MIRIACTALLKRIMAGRPNKDDRSFAGGGEDVTSDCLKAVIEMIGVDETHVVHVNGVPTYEIEIRKYEVQENEQEQPEGPRNGHA